MPVNFRVLKAVGSIYNIIYKRVIIKKIYFVGLLNLGDNKIKNFSALMNLTHLDELYLWGNQIQDILFLENLTNLTSLDLGNNKINDVSALKNLTNLTWLDIWGNQIQDIVILANLKNLSKIYLTNNPINRADIEPLHQQLPNCDIRF